ncbi:hypothetical protein QR98_0035490 [Sarcoptes scabiei]|uniref:Uncharacterized protein n=1 Tax=Sarcoptes scabiei TaxID=52283 RepID=A0A132A3X7_SARSC|nr:hypothetical protein QR98_0035490 [Sarcoptes scabiei]
MLISRCPVYNHLDFRLLLEFSADIVPYLKIETIININIENDNEWRLKIDFHSLNPMNSANST